MSLGLANWTVSGCTTDVYVRVVALLHAQGWLWSSLCDCTGDWAVSTEDNADGDELVRLLTVAGIHCEVYRYGGLLFLLEDVLDGEDKELLALDPETEVG